ncbi:MAG: glutamyl-tRNA reductase [Actinomycetota bacterium]|nr:glutamyl-tRNA reductase [Actinomycetota bacterium]
MPLVAVGISQPELKEEDFSCFAIPDMASEPTLKSLAGSELIDEVVLLSTCARSEVFAVVGSFHAGIDAIIAKLADSLGVEQEKLTKYAHVYYDAGAIRHLFRLAGGLESQILGESEIIGQVKRSFVRAHDLQTTGSYLERLFQRSLEVGKKVRTETGISRGTTSSAYAATELLTQVRPGLTRALVIGAGDIGSKVAQALVEQGVQVHLANRTGNRAEQVALLLGAESVPLEFALANLARYDAAVFATGSTSYLVEKEAVASLIAKEEPGGDLVLIDLGMPRNVDPELAHLASVSLLDLESVYAYLNTQMQLRRSQVGLAEEIVEVEVADFGSRAAQNASIAPTIASFYQMAESIKLAELARFQAKFSDLDPAHVKAIEALAGGIVAKVLHQPVSRLRETNLERAERLAEALSYLFDL